MCVYSNIVVLVFADLRINWYQMSVHNTSIERTSCELVVRRLQNAERGSSSEPDALNDSRGN
jgi:hypothetical protein